MHFARLADPIETILSKTLIVEWDRIVRYVEWLPGILPAYLRLEN